MDNTFSVAEKSLLLTEERASLLTDNLVNSATPQYKAKDFDFYKVMQGMGNHAASLEVSNPHHITSSSHLLSGTQVQYRVPMQMSMDGNTVDPEIERKNFLDNALKYQVSLTFIQGKSDQLMKAVKGE